MRDLLLAMGFLTTIPVPRSWTGSRDVAEGPANPLSGTLKFFPVVGAIVGVIMAAAALISAGIGGDMAAAIAVLVVHVVLTGALHWDGLMDTWDGIFVQREPAERLRIMKEPSVGAFGVMGALLMGIGLFAAVASLAALNLSLSALPSASHPAVALGALGGQMGLPYFVLPLLIAPVFSRSLAVVVMRIFPYLPERGIARLFGRPTLPVVAAVAIVGLALPYLLGGVLMLLVADVTVLIGLGFCLLCMRRLGTLTGDVYGAVILIVEVAFLWGAVVAGRAMM